MVLIDGKLVLIDRATRSIWRYRCTRWPPSKGLLKIEFRLQSKMIAAVQRLQPHQGESPASFVCRRNQAAACMARSHGSWDAEHLLLCSLWYEHLLRPANANSFASILLRHRDAGWLQARREQLRPNSESRGSGTRFQRGFIAPRWEESILSRTFEAL